MMERTDSDRRFCSEMKSSLLTAVILLAACSEIPRDPEGTLERVRSQQTFRVGLIAGPSEGARREAFLAALEDSTGARAVPESGAAEPLLKKLERGSIDLVVGPMTAKSPWRKQVHFLPLDPGEPQPPDDLQLVAMVRNGENRWISQVHREAKATQR